MVNSINQLPMALSGAPMPKVKPPKRDGSYPEDEQITDFPDTEPDDISRYETKAGFPEFRTVNESGYHPISTLDMFMMALVIVLLLMLW
jgi:hypothetical protein